MKAAWYPIKLKFDGEIKKRWEVEEMHLTKLRPKRVKGCSDFKYDQKWFIVVEYCSDRLSVCLLNSARPHPNCLRFRSAMGTLHYGDPDLFDKMVELVGSFGPIFEANK